MNASKSDKNKDKVQDQDRPSREQAELAVKTLLRWIGDDPEREGLLDTPKRVVRAYEEMFSGYTQEPEAELSTFFNDVAGYDSPVFVGNIPFYSHCEHHMVPIIGKAHVAYQPDGQVLGLSKIGRVIDIYAKRLQTQEKITAQVADKLMEFLKPKGVAVLIEANHMCMEMRGVKKQGASTTTLMFRGSYEADLAAQSNFLQLVRRA